MKRFLFILFLVSFWGQGWAQSASRITAKEMMDDQSFNEIFSSLNMKVFHDREKMKEVVKRMHQIDNNSEDFKKEAEGMTGNVFTEEDSQKMDNSIKKMNLKYNSPNKSLDQKLKKAEENPFGAFQEIILETNVPKVTREDMQNLNKIDKQAIPEMLEMITEAGPDVGGGNVSIIYDSE